MVQTILSIVSILSTSIVGYILFNQIKSQKEMIKNYQDYISAIDVKKFKEYIEIIENKKQIEIELEQFKHQIEFEKYDKEKMKKYSTDCSELSIFAAKLMNYINIPIEDKKQIVIESLPSTGDIVVKLIK